MKTIVFKMSLVPDYPIDFEDEEAEFIKEFLTRHYPDVEYTVIEKVE